MTNATTTRDLLRLVGLMAIGIGAAWALQVLGFGGSTAVGKLMWVIGAATIAGAGAGLVYSATSILGADGLARLRVR